MFDPENVSRIPPTTLRTIEADFDATPRRVYTRAALNEALTLHWQRWGLIVRPSIHGFLPVLLAETALREVILKSTRYTSITRYVWREASPYELAASLRARAYFCHGSAIFLHGLTDQVPTVIYLNREQSAKPEAVVELTQEALRRAFSRPQRTSNYSFTFEDHRFVLLSGKHTGRYGVVSMTGPHGGAVEVTSLERTLVDITVRPAYAGGVHHVLAAFAGAKERLSVGRLLATLKNLNYAYPYHQALGFYLERVGVAPKQLDRFRVLGMEFDFFLAHGMRRPSYDPSWRLFYPEGL